MNWKIELKKCLEDKSRAYMIEKYLLIGGLWKGQSKVLDKIISNYTTIVTKSRDVGFTTLMAAYVACELALNSEDSSRKVFVYGSFNNKAFHLFKKKVQEFLDLIPNELFITSNTPYLIRRLWKLDAECFKGPIFEPDTTIIYDEYAYLSGLEFKDIDLPFVKKIIVCSTPNHCNLKWYNLVEKFVNTSSYVRMEWFENPRHRDGDDDPVIELSDMNGNDKHYTNKWVNKRRKNYSDEEFFNDEVLAEVYKYAVKIEKKVL